MAGRETVDILVKLGRRLMRERGIDLTVFLPRAAGMGHHVGNAQTSLAWTRPCNDLWPG